MIINYTNIQQHNNEDFGAYLQRPGFSHSFLKQQKNGTLPTFNVTDNVTIGKIVDTILTGEVTDEIYKHDQYKYCLAIAYFIRNSQFAPLLAASKKQVAYTAEMEYNGFKMPTKGILDLLIPNFAVIDLKVTKQPLKTITNLIKFMGYENQVWHYSKLCNVKNGYLLFYSRADKECKLIEVCCTTDYNEFWGEACLQFGRVGV